jgi:hypothetical protein
MQAKQSDQVETESARTPRQVKVKGNTNIEWNEHIVIDTEFKALIAALHPEEYAQLEDNLRKDNVCREPLVVWTGENILLDGHNRLEICRKYNIPYRVVTRLLGDRDEAKEWILRNQLGRRNLTESQRGSLAAKLPTLERGANQHTAGAASTQAEVAERYQISTDTLQRAKKVERQGIPELQQAVVNGEVSVAAAAEVAELPTEEQREVVAQGVEAIKTKAKQKRARKANREADGSGAAKEGDPSKNDLPDEDRAQLDRAVELWNLHVAEHWKGCRRRVKVAFRKFLKSA